MPGFFAPAGRPILLAPAGSPPAAMAALQAGADAVYVGLKGWSRGGAKGELTSAELLDVLDRKSTRLNSSHIQKSRMPSSA